MKYENINKETNSVDMEKQHIFVRKPYNNKIDSEIKKSFDGIQDIVEVICSSEEMKETNENYYGQDGFDYIMTVVNLTLQWVMLKITLADSVFEKKEMELIKNFALYGDLLEFFGGNEYNWDWLHNNYENIELDKFEELVDKIVMENIIDAFVFLLIASTFFTFGTTGTNELKILLMIIVIQTAGINGKKGADILNEINRGSFLIQDYLFGKAQKFLDSEGYDVKI